MAQLINILQHNIILFLLLIAIISLVIGSFLNVVICRLPVILNTAWRLECLEYLKLPMPPATQSTTTFNLLTPNSHCPSCHNQLTILQNIPIISFIILQGKCKHCNTNIAWQYPIVELLSMTLCVLVAWRFGFSLQTLAGCLLTYTLLVQAVIDYQHTFIPDEITLTMLWLGLLASLIPIFASSNVSIIGASCGYLFLWSIFWLFKLITGKDGMGYGDFKLLAMLGAWLGWQLLPLIIVLSATLGTIVGIGLIAFTKHQRSTPIPFGPYLAIAGWIALMYGKTINYAYLTWIGLI